MARRLAERLLASGVPVSGFTTKEIREGPRRVGFRVEAVGGGGGTLAHMELPGPPRVGKYGVDLPTFEGIALGALEVSAPGGVAIVDELGKMELASEPFRAAVAELFGPDGPAVVATVHAFRHPLTDELAARGDVEVVEVTSGNRDGLPDELCRRLLAIA